MTFLRTQPPLIRMRIWFSINGEKCYFLCLQLLLFWFWLSPLQAHAQIEEDPKATALSSEAPSLRFKQLSLENGLAQGSGNNIMQDKNGFLWVSTQGGLHRYNGYEFEVFTSIPFDTTSLSNNWIWTTTEASNGDLWVATEGGGLNRMNPNTGISKHYRFDPDDSTTISSDRVFYSLEASNGDLWVSTLNNGLNRMRAGEDGKFTRYKHIHDELNSLSSNVLFWISEDANGDIWAGSNNGLNRIEPETEVITRFLSDNEVDPGYGDLLNVLGQYIPLGDQGILWLATGKGLVKLNSETGDFKRYLIEPEKLDLNFLHEVRPDPNDPNILWVGGPGTGIARFDMRTEEFTNYRSDPGDQNSLSDNYVTSLFLDRSGMMWLGMATEGLNIFNPGAVNFTNVKHDPDDPSSLAPGIVWGIYEDTQGTLWVGTDVGSGGGYLTQFDAKTREVTWHRHDPNNQTSLLPGNIRAFAEDEAGQFWVAGERGLNKFDRETGKVKRFLHERTPENRGRDQIFSIDLRINDSNTLLIGSGGGIELFNTLTGDFTIIPLATDSLERGPGVYSTYQDSNGSIWVGTNRGLYHVQPNGEVKIANKYNPQDTSSIRANDVHVIIERRQEPDILWLGLSSGGGLSRFDKITGKASHITTKEGLSDNTIYGMLEDNNGTLWMSTNNGISNYNPDAKVVRNYGLNEGLMALEYDQNAYAKGAGGMLYFGSGTGVTAFAPERLKTNETPPQVVISDIKLFNNSIKSDPNSPLNDPNLENKELTFKYDENEITIDYVALHFANSEKNQYAYQLEGFDKEWVAAGTKRSTTYTNLEPGNYTFKVRASNSDGVWNNEGASIQLTVLPPWYRTWWAYLLFAALLVLVIIAVDRLQRLRISKKEKERAVLREAELRAEAENKRRADTEKLSKIGRAITSSLSIEVIIDTVYENVNALMDASVFGVGIYNKKLDRLDFPATKEEGKVLPAFSNPMDEDRWLAARCYKNEEEIFINNFEREYSKYLSSYSAPIEGKSPKSVLYLPLIHQGRTTGVITTQSFSESAYSEYHINLLRNLANYAAIALDNASAYRKLDATVDELRSTQEQLVHSEKMASLGELTAGIAHEIQNPLNFVNNFSEVSTELVDEIQEDIASGKLEEAKETSVDLKQNLEKINHHGQRASDIVKSMLEHSRQGDSKKEPTDINKLADEYLRLAYHGLRAKDKSFNAEFDLELDELLPEVNVVPQEIGRVLLNLINNAFQSVSSESASRTEKDESQYKPCVAVSTKLVGNSVEIKVSDNGSGIPDEIKDKIFQPFFTTKPTGQGTGLGLSMSYDIIKAHRGEILVESDKSVGTIFRINLPLK